MTQLLAFFLALLSLAAATCYYPGGTVSSNSAVASCLSGATSMCCSLNRGNPYGGTGETDDKCMPNGLCQNAVSAITNGKSVLEIEYWRGSCNNIDWPTEGCIKVCDGGSTINGSVQVTPCDGTADSAEWCCGTDTDCCGTSTAVQLAKRLSNYGSASPSAVTSATSISTSTSTASTSTSTSSSTSTSATSTPTSTSTASTSTSSSTSTSATSTSTSTSTASTSTSSSRSSSTQSTTSIQPTATSSSPMSPALSSKGLSIGAKAGIGVGVSIGFIAIIGSLVLLFTRRRKVASTSPQPEMSYYKQPCPRNANPVEVEGKYRNARPSEVGSSDLYEMSVSKTQYELSGDSYVTLLR